MAAQTKLAPHQFNNAIRLLRRAELDRVWTVRHASFATLKRLGVKRNIHAQHTSTPDGSDQVNVRWVIDWMDRIKPEDTGAIEQLVAIDATAVSRTN